VAADTRGLGMTERNSARLRLTKFFEEPVFPFGMLFHERDREKS
jgi:hypothetical protein